MAISGIPVIAVEEHYWDAELIAALPAAEGLRTTEFLHRLNDLAEIRLADMDAAGIDIQVLSHGAPSGQGLTDGDAVGLIRRVNDRLSQAVQLNPERFYAFAALPTHYPEASADELERCVSELGFKGAMVHGLTDGLFLDEKQFWPIFARAEKLSVPIYLHPAPPHKQVSATYYGEYAAKYPMVMRAAWGFTVEAATQAIRLVLSGVFQTHPNLNFILGHMGETLPFLLWRIDQALSRPGQDALSFRSTFSEHFHITTSGFFSTPALICAMTEIGMDRIMFAVDYPFVDNGPPIEWANQLQISRDDKVKLLSGNARRLLQL